jgi:anti-sigma regulatory factor (Ser/Thr protein kinase)
MQLPFREGLVMTGGTGAVSASRSRARLASTPEPSSSAGTVSQPLQTYLEFQALPTTPACARGHVRSVAREWGLVHLADNAELLVSELITNAVQASERLKLRADQAAVPVVKLWLISDGSSLIIQVWDASNELPVIKDFAEVDDSGRGLFLVETLSEDWGFYQADDGGKVVWCLIAGGQ